MPKSEKTIIALILVFIQPIVVPTVNQSSVNAKENSPNLRIIGGLKYTIL